MTARAGSPTATPPVAELRTASRRYRTAAGPVAVVDQVNLAVHPGEIVGIVGPSGAGKSTLLRLLAGIEEPDAGELRFAGQPAWPRRHGTARFPRPGYVMPVFQDPFASLDPRWPIWRSITEPLSIHGRRTETELRATALDWMTRVRLDDVDPHTRPSRLSGGQAQRVAILRALTAQPALLVADEPVARQDVVTAAATAELLATAARHGAAVVIASHDTAWLDRIATRTLTVLPAQA